MIRWRVRGADARSSMRQQGPAERPGLAIGWYENRISLEKHKVAREIMTSVQREEAENSADGG
jgi:hypothetical protein